MSTVGELVDRTFRDLLSPADDQPTQTTLTADVTSAATTFSYDGAVLAADEEELFAPGVVVEIGLEQAVIRSADHSANTLTVRRGANGTTAAAHTAGAVLVPAPTFGRRAVFDAVCDNVVRLYPSLFHVTTSTVTTASTHVEVPADVVTPVGLRYLSGSQYLDASVSLMTNFTPSSTGKAIMISGAPSGATGYLTYRAKFTRPTLEADDLQVFGVEEAWEPIVMIGAGAQLLAGREFDATSIEFITEGMRNESYPVGSAARHRDGLLRYHQFLLDAARREQLATHAEVISMNTVGAWS